MKKIGIFISFICIIMMVVSIIIHCIYYCNEKITSLFDIILQAIFSGIVTFSGLFVTFMYQKNKDDKRNYEKNIPFLVINSLKDSTPSAEMKLKDAKEEYPTSMTYNDMEENVRYIECIIKNIKQNYALNVELSLYDEDRVKINVFETECLKQFCLKSIGSHNITLYFTDIFGIKYSQIITYEFIGVKCFFKCENPIELKENIKRKKEGKK